MTGKETARGITADLATDGLAGGADCDQRAGGFAGFAFGDADGFFLRTCTWKLDTDLDARKGCCGDEEGGEGKEVLLRQALRALLQPVMQAGLGTWVPRTEVVKARRPKAKVEKLLNFIWVN